ncbi:hypothetical protein D3C80_1530430 [compost metagenome]
MRKLGLKNLLHREPERRLHPFSITGNRRQPALSDSFKSPSAGVAESAHRAVGVTAFITEEAFSRKCSLGVVERELGEDSRQQRCL